MTPQERAAERRAEIKRTEARNHEAAIGPHTSNDHDGTARHHHDVDTGEATWWLRCEQFGGERIEHRHATGEVWPSDTPVDGLDAAYRERNAVVAALIRVGGYPAQVVMAPDTEGWWIVYAETPAGQVSWHVSPEDMDLFSDVPVAFGTHHSPWDGHTTEEKYRRVAALALTQEPRSGDVR